MLILSQTMSFSLRCTTRSKKHQHVKNRHVLSAKCCNKAHVGHKFPIFLTWRRRQSPKITGKESTNNFLVNLNLKMLYRIQAMKIHQSYKAIAQVTAGLNLTFTYLNFTFYVYGQLLSKTERKFTENISKTYI